jgi:hypothetical protein
LSRRAWAFVRRHFLRVLERAACGDISGDPGGAERVTADIRRDAGRGGAPADHPPGVRLVVGQRAAVTIVVPVLMTSCQVSDQPNMGLDIAQTRTTSIACTKLDDRPTCRSTHHREAAALAAHPNSKPCIGCALLGRD